MSRFIKVKGARLGLLKVLSGTLLAQVITLSFLPIITRVYSTEDLGTLTFVTSVSGFVATFASMGLGMAMMLPEKECEARALLFLSLISILIVSIITGIIMALIVHYQPHLATVPFIPVWIMATIILSSLFGVLNRLTLRKSGYGEVGKRAVAQAAGTGGSQAVLSFCPGGGLGLVLGALLGRCIGLVPLARFTKEYFKRPEPGLPRMMLRKYWRFPAVFAPSSALNSFGVQAPLFFVSAWFGLSFAGILGVADRVIGAPMTLIGNAVGQVFDAEMAKKMRGGSHDFVSLYLKVSGGLAIIAIGVGGVFFLLGEWLVPLVLGAEWALAGTCVKVMAVTVSFRLISIPTSRVINLFQRSRGMLFIDAIRALLTVSAMALIVAFEIDFVLAVFCLYTSLTIVYVITWIYGFHVVRDEAVVRSV